MKQPPPRLALWALAIGLCFPAPPSHATTLARLTEAQLVERSSLIVRGKVLRTRSRWNRSKLGIITQVTLQVDQELLKRKVPSQLVVGHYGGTVGKTTMGLPGGPAFRAGQEVVLFLHPNPHISGEYLLTGWTQGIWQVERAKASFPPGTPEVNKLKVYRAAPQVSLHGHGKPQLKLKVNKLQLQPLSQMVTRLGQHWKQLQKRRKAQLRPTARRR